MIYISYSYWNITELTGVFNAVAALVAVPDFAGAIEGRPMSEYRLSNSPFIQPARAPSKPF